MISLSWKCSWQCMKHDIYKVVTCYHRILCQWPITWNLWGSGHRPRPKHLCKWRWPVRGKKRKTSSFLLILKHLLGGCFFHVPLEKKSSNFNKKLDSSTGSSGTVVSVISSFVQFPKSLIVLQIFCCQLQHAPHLCRLHCCHRLELLPAHWIGLA